MNSKARHALIVGLGQIGGSVALALKRRGTEGEVWKVTGCDRDRAATEAALAHGIIDHVADRAAVAAAGAQFVILATPVAEIVSLVPVMAAAMQPGAILLDMGSTKRAVVAAMESATRQTVTPIHCYGGHPIAGTEASGPESWNGDLFAGKTFVRVDTTSSDERSRRDVECFIAILGARVLDMDADAHDEALALTSHLPLLIAHGLVALAGTTASDLTPLIGGSFCSATRVTEKPAEMIAEIFSTNPAALADAYAAFDREMRGLLAALSDTPDALRDRLDRLGNARRRLVSATNP